MPPVHISTIGRDVLFTHFPGEQEAVFEISRTAARPALSFATMRENLEKQGTAGGTPYIENNTAFVVAYVNAIVYPAHGREPTIAPIPIHYIFSEGFTLLYKIPLEPFLTPPVFVLHVSTWGSVEEGGTSDFVVYSERAEGFKSCIPRWGGTTRPWTGNAVALRLNGPLSDGALTLFADAGRGDVKDVLAELARHGDVSAGLEDSLSATFVQTIR